MKTSLLVMALLLAVGLIGCTDPSGGSDKKEKGTVTKKDAGKKHDAWWCDEHGLPEDECWACSDKYCQQCKKAGDWCEKHERPQSQCFKCDPKLKEEWAKKYVAKYGKKPPEFEDY